MERTNKTDTETPNVAVEPDLVANRGGGQVNKGPLAGNEGAFEQGRIAGLTRETTAWDVYNNEAQKVDNELVKDWTASLNFLLVFAAIFAAVLTGFIIDSKKLLEEDQTQTMVDVMIFLSNSLANGTYNPYDRKKFEPTNTAVSINCLLFGSLSASLAAALASVIALQWVADFDAAITRGGSSPEDRAKRRQFRFAGVETWRMSGIIGALPLLLYFSVFLFFAGIIQWTLFLHVAVGYVVIAGALSAGLFYVSSTLLAVIFVSAPFNTPLARWSYSIYDRIYAIIRWVIIASNFSNVPSWVIKRSRGYHSAHKREGLAVESRRRLKYEAMTWVAGQVSLSEDSRQRLLLLVSQLLRWPSTEMEHFSFDMPWVTILNFLARTHVDNLYRFHENENPEELAILMNCSKLPGVNALISPSEKQKPPFDYREWIEMPRSPTTGWLPTHQRNDGLSVLFRVVRNVPIPSLHEEDEIRTTSLLTRWRISRNDESTEVWERVFDQKNTYSTEYFSSCVVMMCGPHELTFDAMGRRMEAMVPIFLAITQTAITGGISSIAIIALIHEFDFSIAYHSHSNSRSCIERPIEYRRALLNRGGSNAMRIHRSLTLLLARNLQSSSDEDKERHLNDVLRMVWITPSEGSRTISSDDDYTEDQLHQEILQDWILHVDGSPELQETLRILIIFSDEGPAQRLRWLYSYEEKKGLHMLRLLRVFDNLLSEAVKVPSIIHPRRTINPYEVEDAVTPSIIIGVLCRELILNESGPFHVDSTPEHQEIPISSLRNCFLRAVAYRALEIPSIEDDTEICAQLQEKQHVEEIGWVTKYMFWNMSEADPPSVWQIRASLISRYPGRALFRTFKAVFRDPHMLANLELIFAHPTACDHYQGPGHLLCHLPLAQSRISFRGNRVLFDTIHLQAARPSLILALLVISTEDDLSLLDLPEGVDAVCTAQLWRYIESFRKSQSALLSLFIDLLPLVNDNMLSRVYNTAVALEAIEDGLLLPDEDESVPLLRPLYEALRELWLNRYTWSPARCTVEEHDALMTASQRVQNSLLDKLVAFSVTGRSNLRLLFCARPTTGVRPATGWSLVYDY